jgi:LPS O-antigen subunit length determinant protein (WzzB/FepE family)
MNETLPSDEIDLLQLIETIWDGKWRIIAITAACVAGVFAFQAISPTPNFVATTEVKPISSKEADQYAPLNSLELFKVTREDLLAQYN